MFEQFSINQSIPNILETPSRTQVKTLYLFIFLGLEAVKHALAAGHQVTALVRNPDKMTLSDDKLNVVSADIFEAENLKTHFTGHDAVLSCLGFPLQKPKVT